MRFPLEIRVSIEGLERPLYVITKPWPSVPPPPPPPGSHLRYHYVAPEFSVRGIYEDEFCWSGPDLEAFVAESIGTQVALPAENKRFVVATNFDVGPMYCDTVLDLKKGLSGYLEFMRNLFP
jgi:hypothetical protein